MSGLTTFAIFGLGKLGLCILASLLEAPTSDNFTIRILTRPGSGKGGRLPPNVTFHPIDYSQNAETEEQLAQALEGIQVIISTVGAGVSDPTAEAQKLINQGKHCGFIPGYANQLAVARAAKRANCQLFIPA